MIKIAGDSIRTPSIETTEEAKVSRDDAKIKHASSSFFCVMAVDGAITEKSSRMFDLTDWERPKNVKNFLELIPKDHQQNIQYLFSKLVQSCQGSEKVQIRLPLVVGRYEVQVPATVIVKDDKLRLSIKDKDLSSIKEIEILRLKGIIQKNSETCLWIVDQFGIIKDVVVANLTKNLGWSDKEVVGLNITTFIHKEDQELTMRKKEKEESITIRRLGKSGKAFTAEVVECSIKTNSGEVYRAFIDTYS